MFRGFILGIIVTLIAAGAAIYFVVTRGIIPANADGPPIWGERWIAGKSLHATLNNEAPKMPDPVDLTPDNLIAGIKLYGQHCAICHGTAKGKASATPLANGLYPRPPQLASDGVEDDPEGYSFWKIKHGIRWTAMPAWKQALNDRQIWILALFLKHMDKLPPAAEAEWEKIHN